MMQAHPVPDVNARGSLAVESMTSRTVALLGARERANQIQLRAGIDNPADAAQNAIHFSKCTKAIDINGLHVRGLRKKFLVAHTHPRNCFSTLGWPSCVQKLTQGKKIHAGASSQIFARLMWSKLNTLHVHVHIEHVNTTDTRIIVPSEFVQATPHECAPIADILPRCPAAIGADNSGAA